MRGDRRWFLEFEIRIKMFKVILIISIIQFERGESPAVLAIAAAAGKLLFLIMTVINGFFRSCPKTIINTKQPFTHSQIFKNILIRSPGFFQDDF